MLEYLENLKILTNNLTDLKKIVYDVDFINFDEFGLCEWRTKCQWNKRLVFFFK